MIARKIYSSIWKDSFFRKLNSKEKLLFLYYCFNENVTSLFCFECSDEQVLIEVNRWGEEVISARDVLVFKEKVDAAGKMKFFEDWVYLVNGRRYEAMESQSVARGRQAMFRRLSPRVQKWYSEISGFEGPIRKTFILDEDEEKVEETVKMIPGLEMEAEEVEEPLHRATGSIKWLDDLPEDEISAFMEKFDASRDTVLREAERCANWCRANGKERKLKNYKAQFRNWMASDYRREAVKGNGHSQMIDLSQIS